MNNKTLSIEPDILSFNIYLIMSVLTIPGWRETINPFLLFIFEDKALVKSINDNFE